MEDSNNAKVKKCIELLPIAMKRIMESLSTMFIVGDKLYDGFVAIVDNDKEVVSVKYIGLSAEKKSNSIEGIALLLKSSSINISHRINISAYSPVDCDLPYEFKGYISYSSPIIMEELTIGYLSVCQKSNKSDPYAFIMTELLAKLVAQEMKKIFYREIIEAKNVIGNQLLSYDLSEREIQILGMITEGITDSEVSTRLHLSTPTVRAHINSIFEKLEVRSKAEVLHKCNINNMLFLLEI